MNPFSRGPSSLYAAILGAAMIGPIGHPQPSMRSQRHDPARPKTPEDLERIAAAQAKQERKAARRRQAA